MSKLTDETMTTRSSFFFILLAGLLNALPLYAGDLEQDDKGRPPQFFLNPNGGPDDTVLLVGTWHFAYPGNDAHKAADDTRVDILSKSRQKEVEIVLSYLEQYQPTAIALECSPDSEWVEKYQDFLAGKVQPMRGEKYQLGFRLGQRVGLDRIYCIDAGSVYSDHKEVMKEIEAIPEDYDYQSDDEMTQRYVDWYEYMNRMQKERTLLETLRYMNRDDVLDAGYGVYLVGDFKLQDFGGADALSVYWYNRNLRIFRHLQDMKTSKEDRILVVFGQGHVQILKQLIDSSPEFQRKGFDQL